jgi:uncharacterized protein (DUF433 family)
VIKCKSETDSPDSAIARYSITLFLIEYSKQMNKTNSLLTRITQTPGQCGGRPCIRGMRIRVSDILEMLAENVSISEILEDFPDLEFADIQACLIFAAKRTEFPRLIA